MNSRKMAIFRDIQNRREMITEIEAIQKNKEQLEKKEIGSEEHLARLKMLRDIGLLK